MSIHELIKNNASSIAAIFTTIATIGGGVIYIESNFASAADIQSISTNQEKQLKIQSSQQRSMTLFQLEYYDDRIRKAQEEKRVTEDAPKSRSRALQKTPAEIQDEINDLKQRREIIRKSIAE